MSPPPIEKLWSIDVVKYQTINTSKIINPEYRKHLPSAQRSAITASMHSALTATQLSTQQSAITASMHSAITVSLHSTQQSMHSAITATQHSTQHSALTASLHSTQQSLPQCSALSDHCLSATQQQPSTQRHSTAISVVVPNCCCCAVYTACKIVHILRLWKVALVTASWLCSYSSFGSRLMLPTVPSANCSFILQTSSQPSS